MGARASKKYLEVTTFFDEYMAHTLPNFSPQDGAISHNHPWGLWQREGCRIFWISNEGCKHARKVFRGQYCWAALRTSPSLSCREVKGSQGILEWTVPRDPLPSQPSEALARLLEEIFICRKESWPVFLSHMMYIWTILKLQSLKSRNDWIKIIHSKLVIYSKISFFFSWGCFPNAVEQPQRSFFSLCCLCVFFFHLIQSVQKLLWPQG